MMFYFEDTTQIEKIVEQENKILILDGTTCLDYVDEKPVFDKKSRLKTFFGYLSTHINNHRHIKPVA